MGKISIVFIHCWSYFTGKNKKQPISDKPDAVNFVLMLKKGNKPVLKDLHIPINSDLAANIHDKQMAQRAEHEEMKRLVLDYNQRQEEESYNGGLFIAKTTIGIP